MNKFAWIISIIKEANSRLNWINWLNHYFKKFHILIKKKKKKEKQIYSKVQ